MVAARSAPQRLPGAVTWTRSFAPSHPRHPQPALPSSRPPTPTPAPASEEAAVVSFLNITFTPVGASDEKNSPSRLWVSKESKKFSEGTLSPNFLAKYLVAWCRNFQQFPRPSRAGANLSSRGVDEKDYTLPNIHKSNSTLDAISLCLDALFLTLELWIIFSGFSTGRVYRDKGHCSREQQSVRTPAGPSDLVICRFKVTNAGAGLSPPAPRPLGRSAPNPTAPWRLRRAAGGVEGVAFCCALSCGWRRPGSC